jgi:hypothetical protein
VMEEEEQEEVTTVSEDDEEDKDEVTRQWRRFRQLNEEERELIEEGVRRGEGFKDIEDMLRARRGEFRGLAAQVFEGVNVSAAVRAQKPIGLGDAAWGCRREIWGVTDM